MQPVVPNRAPLTEEELRRYGRHLLLPAVGREGQERLKAAKVVVVGAGGLGSPVALYLAAAGIGAIGMVDFDVVDFSNLQRQLLHFTPDTGKPKLQSAGEKLAAINPGVRFVPHPVRLSTANALDILDGYDVVVDGTDNFATRYLVNDASFLLKKPRVYGSIHRFEGMASVFAPHLGGPCYRCWYPEPPPPGMVPNCAEAGVLGVLCGIVGSIQAAEAIKLIIGQGDSLLGRLLRLDALTMKFREHRLPRDPSCPLCGRQPSITRLTEIAVGCSTDDITAEELAAMRAAGRDFVLVDVRTPEEVAVCEISGSVKLPIAEMPTRLAELPKDKLIVLHCHSGVRSARALKLLQEQGYTRLKNLAGGIEAWRRRSGD